MTIDDSMLPIKWIREDGATVEANLLMGGLSGLQLKNYEPLGQSVVEDEIDEEFIVLKQNSLLARNECDKFVVLSLIFVGYLN